MRIDMGLLDICSRIVMALLLGLLVSTSLYVAGLVPLTIAMFFLVLVVASLAVYLVVFDKINREQNKRIMELWNSYIESVEKFNKAVLETLEKMENRSGDS